MNGKIKESGTTTLLFIWKESCVIARLFLYMWNLDGNENGEVNI